MSTVGERKCALMLMSLHPSDRRRLLGRLPHSSARSIRTLIRQLRSHSGWGPNVAEELLADEVIGLSPAKSLNQDQLLSLSKQLPASWFARLISVWPGVDKSFLLSLLDKPRQMEVRTELAHLDPIPAKLKEALRGEAMRLVSASVEAG